MNEALSLPGPSSSVPTEAAARAAAAAALQALRGATELPVWAERWSRALGREITPATAEAFEDPRGPKPPIHWVIVAAGLAGAEAAEAASRLLLA